MEQNKKHLCPVWVGYFLINPLRKLFQSPNKILGPYIMPGMKMIDFGSAMGYFSIPMAKTAGKTGKVYCLDIQQKMLEKLKKRAKRNHVEQIIEPCLIDDNFTIRDLQNQIDFALLFAVVHEVSDKQKLFDDISGTLKSNRKIVFAEPSGHVSKKEFEESVKLAEKAGMLRLQKLKIHRSHAVLLCKE